MKKVQVLFKLLGEETFFVPNGFTITEDSLHALVADIETDQLIEKIPNGHLGIDPGYIEIEGYTLIEDESLPKEIDLSKEVCFLNQYQSLGSILDRFTPGEIRYFFFNKLQMPGEILEQVGICPLEEDSPLWEAIEDHIDFFILAKDKEVETVHVLIRKGNDNFIFESTLDDYRNRPELPV